MFGPFPYRFRQRVIGWLWLLLILVGCQSRPVTESHPTPVASASPVDGPIQIVASIPPLASLVERLGGDAVQVSSLIPAGASPHSFSLSPRNAADLERAAVIVQVGHPLDTFETSLLGHLSQRHLPPVLIKMISTNTPETVGQHPWLSPAAMIELAPRISLALEELLPSRTLEFQRDLQLVLSETELLQKELRTLFKNHRGETFLVYHPAWESLAQEFNLRELAVESEGKELSPRQLTTFIEQLRPRGFDRLFVQPGFPELGAQLVARELNLDQVTLDPLDPRWFEGLLESSDKIIEGLVP